ncbi:hypothetical protein CEUSTIGMA_g9896.t1 [Chlamydomonas eustigma]|uniref:CCHC-type domain-containing protein n=1 Tax=Chlamydomonas eustigma TaxID=1157962 RepID=A0A250XHS5_9CHLO|nr:hypothetical protein CEUSTIGMA_g9896.t1 [Chlamydomonas eustigma]|eukprot:GAX82469.1 hypothetical protein CEUSTIGMA_g9896.t1 [Chlamydomonas eustigma]
MAKYSEEEDFIEIAEEQDCNDVEEGGTSPRLLQAQQACAPVGELPQAQDVTAEQDDTGNCNEEDEGSEESPWDLMEPVQSTRRDKRPLEVPQIMSRGSGNTNMSLSVTERDDLSSSMAMDCARLKSPMASVPVGVILVQDRKEIARDVEMTRLIRQPRYYDDVSVDIILAGRCFNCGKAGHRSSECTFAAREKPCYLCAKFGHEARACPAELCFKCGLPGHKSRDCTQSSKVSSWEMGAGRCLRCACTTCACANRADYFRYEGGCSEDYLSSDILKCKCYVCGRYGHTCCKKTPLLPARMSCYSCGSSEHLGEACPSEWRPHIAAERNGDMRAAQQERQAEIERVNFFSAMRAPERHQGVDHQGRVRYSDQFDVRQPQQQNYPYQFSGEGGAGYMRSYPGSVDRDHHMHKRNYDTNGRIIHQAGWGGADIDSLHGMFRASGQALMHQPLQYPAYGAPLAYFQESGQDCRAPNASNMLSSPTGQHYNMPPHVESIVMSSPTGQHHNMPPHVESNMLSSPTGQHYNMPPHVESIVMSSPTGQHYNMPPHVESSMLSSPTGLDYGQPIYNSHSPPTGALRYEQNAPQGWYNIPGQRHEWMGAGYQRNDLRCPLGSQNIDFQGGLSHQVVVSPLCQQYSFSPGGSSQNRHQFQERSRW